MTKDEAITLHLKQWEKFPVFVWMEDHDYVTEVDGHVIRAKSYWQLDTKLDGVAPQPRNLYLVDAPDYEDGVPNAALRGGEAVPLESTVMQQEDK